MTIESTKKIKHPLSNIAFICGFLSFGIFNIMDRIKEGSTGLGVILSIVIILLALAAVALGIVSSIAISKKKEQYKGFLEAIGGIGFGVCALILILLILLRYY